MIRLAHVHKAFRVAGTQCTIARDIHITLPGDRTIALLGRNGAGKSSLLQMIAGTMLPDKGSIDVKGSISWPVGFQGSFHRDLTGAQNTRFVARAYGVDTDQLCEFVRDFSELGAQFHAPVRTYSSGMRARLAFACSMGIRFDFYLVDEVTAVGDGAFREKSEAVFIERMKESGALFVSHAMPSVRRVCDAAVVLENGVLTWFDNVDDGIRRHHENLSA